MLITVNLHTQDKRLKTQEVSDSCSVCTGFILKWSYRIVTPLLQDFLSAHSDTILFCFLDCDMDFESGVDSWTRTGNAFDNQPTYGDNPKYRNHESANQQGDWWIGGAENRPSPSHPAGQTQGDAPTGTMTSPTFTISGNVMSFLVGGGCDINTVRVELIVHDQVVRNETGKCFESMERREWNVSDLKGKMAQVRLIDNASGGWGHINFDDLRGDFCF